MTRTTSNTPFHLSRIHNHGDCFKIILNAADGVEDGIEMTVKGHLSVKPFKIDSRLTSLENYQNQSGPHSAVAKEITQLETSTYSAVSSSALADAKLQGYSEGFKTAIALAKGIIDQELSTKLKVYTTDDPLAVLKLNDGRVILNAAKITISH